MFFLSEKQIFEYNQRVAVTGLTVVIWQTKEIRLFCCTFNPSLLTLKIQNFSNWLLPLASMIKIENVGVWWTSQQFTIATFDSRLFPALVYFHLLPLLEFFRPVLPPQQVSVSLTLPHYVFLTPICVGCLCHLVSSLRAKRAAVAALCAQFLCHLLQWLPVKTMSNSK